MKRALLIGINYIGSTCELNGCINDTINMKKLLIEMFNYKEENMIMLDDGGVNPLKPTRDNILKYFNQVVDATGVGDTLFVHYSGHGSLVADKNQDEVNNPDAPGMDSVLCPCDYDKYPGEEGFILDDTLKIIVNKLPKGSKLRMFADCCMGASLLDLEYIYKKDKFLKVEAACEGTDDILTVSGSFDSQTSADTYINGQYTGALTFSLLKVLNNTNKVSTSWAMLLSVIQHYLATEGYTQVPTLCTANKKLLKQKIDL